LLFFGASEVGHRTGEQEADKGAGNWAEHGIAGS
jgi:hypothetical protein